MPLARGAAAAFEVGQKVQAKFKGGQRYFPGTIAQVHRDGSCDIEYDDGDFEPRVLKHKIRAVRGAGAGGGAAAARPAAARRAPAAIASSDDEAPRGGAEVALVDELRAAGSSQRDMDRYRRAFELCDTRADGRVSARDFGRVLNGFKINFSPGDLRAAAQHYGDGRTVKYQELLDDVQRGAGRRAAPQRGVMADDSMDEGAFSRGERVEARFKRGRKYFAGRITAVNGDGSYSIAYDDGDKERSVPASLIRKASGATSPAADEDIDQGGMGARGGRTGRAGASSATEEIAADLELALNGTALSEDKLANLQDTFEMIDQDATGRVPLRDFQRTVERARIGISFADTRSIASKLASDGQVRYGIFIKGLRAASQGESGRGGRRSPNRRGSPGRRGTSAGGAGAAFQAGQRVEARFKRGRKFFKGVVTRARPDGTYDIDYDDGDREQRVDPGLMRAMGGVALSDDDAQLDDMDMPADILVGDKVEARFKGGRRYFKGMIKRVHPDGSFDIAYDDGDSERRVPADRVRALPKAPVRGARGRNGPALDSEDPSDSDALADDGFQRGDVVEARFKGGRKFFKGKITRVNVNGTYDIAYVDGDRERGVDASVIRRVGGRAGASPRSPLDEPPQLARGDRVEALFKGGRKYYKGRITRVNVDGSYDIDYDDGDKERRVAASKVRPLGGSTSPSRRKPAALDDMMDSDMDAPLGRGDRVEALFKGGRKYYKGRITRVNVDGSYDIDYDDGDKERRVAPAKVRRLGGSTSPSRRKPAALDDMMDSDMDAPLDRGDRVEALFKGGRKYYKGRITRVNVDGSYDIDYDDGDKERRVAPAKVRRLGGSTSPSRRKPAALDDMMDSDMDAPLDRGDRVEALFKGGRKYYKGRITRVNVDGSYDIDYDDGDKERRVAPAKVRRLGGSTSPSRRKPAALDDMMDSDMDAPLGRGDRVEALFKGGRKYYKGRITRVNVDGSYDIDYDDGDKERRVAPAKVRRLGGSTSPSRKKPAALDDMMDSDMDAPLGRGDRVEALFKGGRKYYKGRITRVNVDGSYDIDYDDGDKERRVAPAKVRRLGALRESPGRQRGPSGRNGGRTGFDDSDSGELDVGARVEAYYKGGKRLYKGKITRVNVNGTFDIAYDDGDRERGVRAELVKPAGGRHVDAEADSDLDGIKVGTKVEAKYRGGAKYYKGRVSHVHADGTFDIDYDDGDRERRVVPSKVRVLRGSPTRGRREADPLFTEPDTPPALSRGDRVEARYKGGRKLYKGAIERVHADGSCDIRYDDGDFERRVKSSMIKSLEAPIARSKSRGRHGGDGDTTDDGDNGILERGSRVEARFKGGAKYYKGTITRVNPDGTFGINYDDGDREPRVRRALIRAMPDPRGGRSPRSALRRTMVPEGDSDASEQGSFSRGDRIEALYKGGRKYYKGKIARVRANGTYDIEYDDGDSEMRVQAASIRLQRAGGSRSPSKRLSPRRRRGRGSESSESGSSDEGEDLAVLVAKVVKRGVRDGALDNYHEVFDLFDRNNDGFVSRAEFGRALDKLGLRFTHGELKRIVRKFDTDGDGRICYREFMKLVRGRGRSGSPSKRGRSRGRSQSRRSASSGSSSSGSDGALSGLRSRSRSKRSRRTRSRGKRHSRRRRDDSSGGSSGSSAWSSSDDDSALDESWDSDSEAEQDEMLHKFEAYMGRKFNNDKKKRYKAAFKRVDRQHSGKIRCEKLGKVLMYMRISKKVSKALQKRLVDKYGRGTKFSVYYNDMVTGCKEAATAVKEGKGPSFANQVDDLLAQFRTLAQGRDVGAELAKLDKHSDLLLPTKVLTSYLVKIGFKKGQRSALGHFLSYFELPDKKGKVPYQDFVSFAMDKDRAAKELPGWKRATTGVDIKNGMQKLREEREKREQEGVDPLVWQVLTKLRQVIADALQRGLAKDYSDAFELFDLDKDGKITTREMAQALERIGFDVNEQEVSQVMSKLDESGKGMSVDYKHFLLFCTRGSDRDQWALGADGTVVGNTFAGELESSIRQKVRKAARVGKAGRGSVLRAFRNVDRDGEGFVNRRSLRKIAANLNWALTNEDLACLMARFDLQGQDKFAYKEFVNFLTLDDDAIFVVESRLSEFVASMISKGADMKDCFEMFDRNNDGKISAKELCGAMMKLGFPVAGDEAKELIRRVDVDRDGKINFAEFLRAFAPRQATATGPVARANDENASPRANGSTALSALQLVNAKPFTTGTYLDWTDGLVNPGASIPLAPKGSVGEWLEKVASPLEQRNFFAFLQLVSNFEKRLGLQQSRAQDSDQADGEITLQLGSKLKVSLKFHV